MRRTWTWTFALPPDRLWPVLADTERFNEAMSLPAYTLEPTLQPNGTVVRRGRGKAAGFALEWEEKPYEWIAGRHFRQSRLFTKGPFRRFGPVFDIEPDGRGGSHVTYALEWEPLSLVGRAFGARLAAQAGEAVGKRTLEAVAFARGDRVGERLTPFELPPPELPPGARERAATLAGEVDRSPYGNGLGQRLAEIVLGSMATDVAHLKPKVLAIDLGVPPRAAIEACLAAVKAGLLTMKWGLLCPNCRGAKLSVSTLSELPRGAHCSSCNIDYDRDFEKNVELYFAPAPAIRAVVDGGFCLSGPMGTPHVAVQVLLDPGERRNVNVDLPPGSYRLRTLHPGAFVDFDHESGPFPGLRVTASGVEVLDATDHPGEAGSVAFVNDAGFELAALIEDRTWVRDALTAPEVISLQAFRDLFAEATLRPGDDAGVSQVALLFTDLQGSTALYERVGDAAAYNLVRKHFALLAAIVRDHDGAVVKTIGDAVMAAFSDPAQAVHAALAMQAEIGSSERGVPDLVLKVGVHAGPSVVVTLNDRLDYFGSTVNMAARLQGQSTGGDIVLSTSVADDPEVREMLAAIPQRPETVALKGFAEPVGFIRLLSGASSADVPQNSIL
ncbi:adenylate/guanylate cyclase domain-containing protein [Mycolicibacterium moriokaense]|uniref:Class 3 adenylate cyclase n=1 Tax=Mycolicibacterium moriokaense TaxID=39691 RepID=A0A318HBG8_9MYCO|nr:adenylate/guanylate cyclase domain-containing protein [Mycolicibacterium moriokaense]PXX05508.1 class 3 adenylate cyclase [Mycolicibacterium moriokaense]